MIPDVAVEAAWDAFYASKEDMGAALEAASPYLLERITAELAYQTARAEYCKYVPEIENDPEGVAELRATMRALRAAL